MLVNHHSPSLFAPASSTVQYGTMIRLSLLSASGRTCLVRNSERQLYRADSRWAVNHTNVTADGKFVITALFENLSDRFPVDLLNGYVGFREYFEAKPESRIIAVPR